MTYNKLLSQYESTSTYLMSIAYMYLYLNTYILYKMQCMYMIAIYELKHFMTILIFTEITEIVFRNTRKVLESTYNHVQ